ncbi:chemotaxis protein CheA [Paracoccus gahaiensis]|uniref:Chemotaxis protein CheA n=2 Tax=Paracoccus gahaiensis TaxID=1706839 RepID=A0A4U0R662_9RHOB|nr:chemotaxis protein CheA [Paracoccus gahaiensis]
MFFVECDELLEVLAGGLRQMEAADLEKEIVHSVFRAVHSIKGGAAAFGLSDLVTFAHRFETVLDLIRSDRMEIEAPVMTLLHRCSDGLADLIESARAGLDADRGLTGALLAELDALIDSDGSDEGEPIVFTPITLDFGDVAASPPAAALRIRMSPSADLYRSGNDPVALMTALRKLGPAEVSLLAEEVAPLESWDPDQPGLAWDIRMPSSVTEAQILTVFEFVEDCCRLFIDRLAEVPGPALSLAPLADFLAVPAPDAAPPMAPLPPPGPARIDPAPVQLAPQTPATPDPEPADPIPAVPGLRVASSAPEAAAAPAPTIRVGLERVDRLMNMIGELVIKEAMLSQTIQTAGLQDAPDVVAGLDSIRQLAGEIQESVMAIRAQPLKLVFQRMHRILREAADATGKPVRLITLGEQTEVDKTMIERLVDPLTHMIRNSVDHGLEDSVTRQRRGKPAEGVITLSAAHRSGRVQIEVSDDGGGIDRPRVRQIAEERGLVAPGTPLSAAEIDQLLFLPGFSCKDQVSALSGRGVGLDVVRREIMSLGGRVMIHSVEGEGTTFSIALPLTLAVLEGMLIQLGDQTMVLPITAVQETLQPNRAMLHGMGAGTQLLSSRGELIPIVDLCSVFGLPAIEPLESAVLIVVETDTRQRAAFRVDSIFDQRQVVIKSLEQNYGRVPGVSAATILGDGQIALIIDPEEIVLSLSNDQGRLMAAMAANG